MPTKSRTTPVACWGDDGEIAGEVWFSPYTPSAKLPPPPNYATMESEETISYENGNRNRPNPCVHTSTWKATKAFLVDGFTLGGVHDWDYHFESPEGLLTVVLDHVDDYRHIMPNSPWSVPRSQLLETDTGLVDIAIAEALGSLRLGCREQVFALPRAILELRDVPRTLKNVAKLNAWVGGILDKGTSAFKLPPVVRGRSLGYRAAWVANKSVSELCSQYLGYIFGIKPTKKDVNTFLGRPDGLRRPLKLAATQPKLYKGQNLEIPFKVGPPSSSFPTLSSYSLEYDQGLLRNFHSSNGIREHISGMRGNAYRCVTHSGVVFGRVVGVPQRIDMTYGEQLSMSGGGPLATAWELIPYTWVSDSCVNIGKLIAQAERRALPLELRPTLEFGSWLSHKQCESIYLPQYKVMNHTVQIKRQCDPYYGYNGVATVHGSIYPAGYQAAFESNLLYSRYEMVGRFDDVGMPIRRYPGGYMLGPLAAVFAQFAAQKMLK